MNNDLPNLKVEKKDNKSIKEFIKDLHQYITSKNTKELLELLIRILIVAAIVLALSLPFSFLGSLAGNIMIELNINYANLSKFETAFNIVYLILGIIIFIILLRDRFYKLLETQEIINKEKNKQNGQQEK